MDSTDLDDREIWVSHINYELSGLAELPRWIEHYGAQGPAIVEHACLEAALIHARLLIEFLVGRPGSNGSRTRFRNDVTPNDFLPAWQYSDPTRFDDRLRMIDRYLAHLSKSRSDGKIAPANLLIDLIDDILDAFAALVHDLALMGSEYAPAFQGATNHAKVMRSKHR